MIGLALMIASFVHGRLYHQKKLPCPTPPVGTALFVALKVANLLMDKIIAPLLPLLACMCAVLLFVTYVPDVYVWLPRGFGLVK